MARLFTVCFVFVLCIHGLSQEIVNDETGDKRLLMQVKGQFVNQDSWRLDLKFGGIVPINEVRIFSYPSNKLMVRVVDPTFGRMTSAEKERVGWTAPETDALNTITGPVNIMEPRLVMRHRPKGDTRLIIWVHGRWDTGEGGRVIADADVGELDFAFSGFVVGE